MRPPEVIETHASSFAVQLWGDAPALFERYTRDPEVTRYLAWRPHEDVTRTEAFLQRCAAVWEKGEAFPWVIVLRAGDEPIGMIELRMQGHRAELGYVLARSHWKRGYMTKAARAVVEWALRQPEVFRVWAVCDVENVASRTGLGEDRDATRVYLVAVNRPPKRQRRTSRLLLLRCDEVGSSCSNQTLHA